MDVILVRVVLVGGKEIKYSIPGKITTAEQESQLFDAIAGALYHADVDVSGVILKNSVSKKPSLS